MIWKSLSFRMVVVFVLNFTVKETEYQTSNSKVNVYYITIFCQAVAIDVNYVLSVICAPVLCLRGCAHVSTGSWLTSTARIVPLIYIRDSSYTAKQTAFNVSATREHHCFTNTIEAINFPLVSTNRCAVHHVKSGTECQSLIRP